MELQFSAASTQMALSDRHHASCHGNSPCAIYDCPSVHADGAQPAGAGLGGAVLEQASRQQPVSAQNQPPWLAAPELHTACVRKGSVSFKFLKPSSGTCLRSPGDHSTSALHLQQHPELRSWGPQPDS